MSLRFLFYILLVNNFCVFSAIGANYVLTHASSFNGIYEPVLSRNGNLVGGLPRLYSYVRDKPFILSGDLIRKSLTTGMNRLYVDRDVVALLKPSVYVLGVNEFHLTPESYTLIANQSEVTISCVNVELPLTATDVKLKNSEIIVMGYCPTARQHFPLVSMNNLVPYDPIETLTKKIASYERTGKKHIYVAAGCAGYDLAKKIAEHVDGVDIVISGCSHFMQWNGEEPPDNIPKNSSYPAIVVGAHDRKVLLAHSYGSTKFVGELELEIDGDVNITDYKGSMVYMGHSLPEDKELETIIEKIKRVELAYTRVFLSDSCHSHECNLGNLIADSFVEYKCLDFKGENWTDTSIGIVLSGNIKSGINASTTNGIVLAEHLLHVFRHPHRLVTVEISGRDIRRVFEHTLATEVHRGMFLQVSGLHVRYDRRRPYMQRFNSLMVKCSNCTIPLFEDLQMGKVYRMVTTSDMLEGAFGQSVFADNAKLYQLENITDYLALRTYLMSRKLVNHGREDRLIVIGANRSERARSTVAFVRFLVMVGMSLSV